MGIWGYIKQVKSALSEARKMIKMTTEELLSLDDEKLYDAINIRIAWEIRWAKSRDNYAEVYQGAKRAFYVVTQYDWAVNNGGLCQYFINPSRLAAPYLLSCLNEIGASEYAKLLSDFLTVNSIDVNDLSSFIIKDLSEFSEQNKRYPFDTYDDAFYKLYEAEPLITCLMTYVRQHIEEL